MEYNCKCCNINIIITKENIESDNFGEFIRCPNCGYVENIN